MNAFRGYRDLSRPGRILALAMRRWLPHHSINLLLGCLIAILWPLLANGPAYAAGPTLLGQTIRYHHSEAGEVFILWGVNGWYKAPEAQWPPGTVAYNDKNKYPYTPMTREGETFVVTIQAPLGTTIDYVFNITKDRNGESVDVWDIKSEQVRDYHTVVIPDTIAEAYSVMPLEQAAPGDPVSIGLRWGVPAILVAVCLIGGMSWLRRKLRNPFLDF